MKHRTFFIAWVIGLVALGAASAWATLRPALLDRSQASLGYEQVRSISGQSKLGTIPVQVGISIEKISDFSVKNVAWNADFLVWFKWRQPPASPSFDPGQAFEIVTGTIVSKQKIIDQVQGPDHYSLYRVSATINYPFNVARYPMDDHLLSMFLQDPIHPQIQYIADRVNSRVDPAIRIPGYQIAQTVIGVQTVPEDTTFGIPSGQKEFEQFGFGIFILRQGFGFFLKLFQALFVAVGVALLAGFFKAHEEIRVELLVGGLFAAVANTYITSSYLPDTGTMTLMDQVNLLGLGVIFICLIQTVISSRFAARDELDFCQLFDRTSFALIAFFYISLNVILPLAARMH